MDNWKSQIVISNKEKMGLKKAPMLSLKKEDRRQKKDDRR